MKNNKFAYLLGMVGLAILTMIILWIIAIVGSMDLTDGCLYRYNLNNEGNLSNSDVVSNTVTLKANANYTGSDAGVSSTGGTGVALDPNAYGKWLNTNLRLKPDQFVQFYIKGEVSLCKAYIPINNLQQDSNLDVDGKKIEIPRVEDQTTPPVSLILDARTPNWKNLTELYRNDRFYVALYHRRSKTQRDEAKYVIQNDCPTADEDCCFGYPAFWNLIPRSSLSN